MNIPRLNDTDMLRLAQAVQDMLKEVDECTVKVLKTHGLEQHAADLEKRSGELCDALSPFIESGDEELWAELGIHVEDDEE